MYTSNFSIHSLSDFNTNAPFPPFSAGEESAFLGFKKGDLIHMENAEGDDVIKSGHCYGECIRTRTKGDFPAECVYVLPTISRPTAEVLVSCKCTSFHMTCDV